MVLKKLLSSKLERTGIKKILSLLNSSFNFRTNPGYFINQYDLKMIFETIGENLIWSLRSDFTDFHEDNNFSILTPENSNVKINSDRINDFLESFTELSSLNVMFLGHKFFIMYSYLNFNGTTVYKVSVEMDGFLLVEKIETSFNSRFIKDSLINGTTFFDGDKFVLLNPRKPTYFYKSSLKEHLSVVYEEESYFDIVSRLALVKK